VYQHGKKDFVVLTKSFVKIGITKTFCYINKMFSSVNKSFGCCRKIFGCSNKKFIRCQFCCRNKSIFSVSGASIFCFFCEWYLDYFHMFLNFLQGGIIPFLPQRLKQIKEHYYRYNHISESREKVSQCLDTRKFELLTQVMLRKYLCDLTPTAGNVLE